LAVEQEKELDFVKLEQSRSYKVYSRAVKNPVTLKQYNYYLREFLRYAHFTSYDEIVACNAEKIQELLENWMMDLADRGIKGTSIRTRLAPVELLLEMNRVLFYKKILHRLLPKDEGELGGNAAYTNEDIRLMLGSTTKLRTKALIHFLASTGARPGALTDPVLRKKHLVDMPLGCIGVRIYDNHKEGYWAFLTPEASRALTLYLNTRIHNGEILDEESPIFAKEGKRFGYLANYNMKNIMMNLMKISCVERKKIGKRYDKAMNYGFRKRFNGILKMNNEVNSNIAEKLMAHKKGLDGTYLKPTREECFAEFQKAIQDLTIDNSERLLFQNKKLEVELSKQARLEEENSSLQKKISEIILDLEKVKKHQEMTEKYNRINNIPVPESH